MPSWRSPGPPSTTGPSTVPLADAELMKKIHDIFEASRRTYGWPRVHAALRRAGTCASRKRVARLMSQAGLVGLGQRRKTRTTFSGPEAKALDLVKRAFGPGTEPDRTWVGDITYVRTWEGWLYLASVIELACDALAMAIAARRPRPGLIFHSDRGSQPSTPPTSSPSSSKTIWLPRASRGRLNAGATRSRRVGSRP